MKITTLFIVASFLSLVVAAAEDKPTSTPAVAPDAKLTRSEAARIAELEARVANLEKIIESLRKAVSSLPAIKPPSEQAASTDSAAVRDRRGPTEEDRRRYESLSDSGKEKLRSFFRDHADEIRNLAGDEARREFVRKAFDKIVAEDKTAKP